MMNAIVTVYLIGLVLAAIPFGADYSRTHPRDKFWQVALAGVLAGALWPVFIMQKILR